MKKSRENSTSRRRRVFVGTLSALLLVLSVLTASPAEASSRRVVVSEGESIQAAIDAAAPKTRIVVEGAHVENLWVNKDGIEIVGRDSHASITMPEEPAFNRCAPLEFSPVICFFPDTETDPPAPNEYLRGGLVKGLTINGGWDSVSMIFTNRAEVRGNTMNGQGCNGAFVIFATKFDVNGNDVSDSPFCDGILVLGSNRGTVRNNTSTGNLFAGISVQDSQRVTVRDNVVAGNCIGIVAVDSADQGFEGPDGFVFDEDQPQNRITIRNNNASENDGLCFPFGPDIPIGGAGILVGGQKITVKDNVANNNGFDGVTFTPGGIIVPAQQDPSLPPTDNVEIKANTAFGNFSEAGPADVVVQVDPGAVRARRNDCGISTPDATICTGGS